MNIDPCYLSYAMKLHFSFFKEFGNLLDDRHKLKSLVNDEHIVDPPNLNILALTPSRPVDLLTSRELIN